MRQLDGITLSLNRPEFQQTSGDSEGHAAVHKVARVRHNLGTEQQQFKKCENRLPPFLVHYRHCEISLVRQDKGLCFRAIVFKKETNHFRNKTHIQSEDFCKVFQHSCAAWIPRGLDDMSPPYYNIVDQAICSKNRKLGTSLVAQWMGSNNIMQGSGLISVVVLNPMFYGPKTVFINRNNTNKFDKILKNQRTSVLFLQLQMQYYCQL